MAPIARSALAGLLFLPWIPWATGCQPQDGDPPADDDGGTGDDDGGVPYVAVETPAAGGAGDVAIAYRLHDEETRAATVQVWFRAGSDGLEPATPGPNGDPTEGAASAPDGERHVYVWDSRADLGIADVTGVVVRVSATAGDAEFAPGETDPFDVANAAAAHPPTVVVGNPEPTLPSLAVDGDVAVPFRVEDLDADPVTLRVEFDDGSGPRPATAAASSGPVVGLSPGHSGEFVWDATADLGAADVPEVIVRMTPSDDWLTGEPEETSVFAVENDPSPGPGEVVISEILFWPTYFTSYVELQNVTRHRLDLSGLRLEDQDGGSDPLVGLEIDAGDHAVLADVPDAFSFYAVDLHFILHNVEISRFGNDNAVRLAVEGGDEHDRVEYLSFGIGEPGRSMQLLGAYAAPDLNDEAGAWCTEGGDIGGSGDLGSPGGPTNCVAIPTSTLLSGDWQLFVWWFFDTGVPGAPPYLLPSMSVTLTDWSFSGELEISYVDEAFQLECEERWGASGTHGPSGTCPSCVGVLEAPTYDGPLDESCEFPGHPIFDGDDIAAHLPAWYYSAAVDGSYVIDPSASLTVQMVVDEFEALGMAVGAEVWASDGGAGLIPFGLLLR